MRTHEQVEVKINQTAISFQVVSNSFYMEFDGMLVMPFLFNSMIDLQTKQIQNKLGIFPILEARKNVNIKLKARNQECI